MEGRALFTRFKSTERHVIRLQRTETRGSSSRLPTREAVDGDTGVDMAVVTVAGGAALSLSSDVPALMALRAAPGGDDAVVVVDNEVEMSSSSTANESRTLLIRSGCRYDCLS